MVGGLGVQARQNGPEQERIHSVQRIRAPPATAESAVSRGVVRPQLADRRLEVLQRVECLVDAREPQVRDLVELAERAEDRQADLVGVHLGRPGLAHGLFDLLREHREVALGDRPALTCLADARHDLLATERLDHARPLDDVQTGRLDRREAAAALGTLATATDAETVVARPRIDDARVGVATERAVHGRARLRRAARRFEPVEARATTASPCAGSCSASASATIASRTSARARRSYRITCCGRRKVAADEPGAIARLSARRQHVIAAGEVVAEAHGRVGSDEDRAGVDEFLGAGDPPRGVRGARARTRC